MSGNALSFAAGFDLRPLMQGARRMQGIVVGAARGVAGRIKSFITSPLGAIAAGISGFFTYAAFKSGIQGVIEAGGEMHRLHVMTGMAIGSISMLKGIAGSASVPFEVLTASIPKMEKGLVSAARGGGPLASTFRLLKLDASALLRMKPEVAFASIGKQIAALPSPMARSAAAMTIFGRAGAQLLPVFERMGEVDIGQLNEKAKLLEESGQTFHEITVLFHKAGANLKGVFLGIAAEIAPQLLQLGKALNGINFIGIGRRIGVALRSSVEWLLAGFRALPGIWAAFMGEANNSFIPLTAAIKEGFNSIFDFAAAKAKMFMNSLLAGWNKIAGSGLGKALGLDQVKSIFDPKEIDAQMAAAVDEGKFAGALFRSIYQATKDAIAKVGKEAPTITVSKKEKAAWGASLTSTGLVTGSLGNGLVPLQGPGLKHSYAASPTVSNMRGAYGQTGGMGSLSRAAYNKLTDDQKMGMLFSSSERAAMQNQLVAAGAERQGSSAGAFGVVRSGDAARRKAYEREQLKQKAGLDKTNSILEQMYDLQKEAWED